MRSRAYSRLSNSSSAPIPPGCPRLRRFSRIPTVKPSRTSSEKLPTPSDWRESLGLQTAKAHHEHFQPQTLIPPCLPSIRPESTFDAVLELRLAELHQQVAEIKGRINTLFFFVMIAAILQFVFGITGVTPW